VLDNEQHTIRIGQRVPVRTAQFVGSGTTIVDGNNRGNNPNFSFGTPATQFQYENVGLNIDMQPMVHEDMVQIKMKIETSDVGAEGVGGNPIFTQRTMSSVASIRNGQTTLIAGVSTENKGRSVQGIPFLSLLPGIGRLFATPRETSAQVDVVITVTPYVLRAPVYSDEDYVPISAGTPQAPDRQISLEEIVYRAELEESGASATTPPIASAGGTPAQRAAPAQPRPAETNVDVRFPGVPAAEAPNRPVATSPGEVIRTPGGSAAAPVVAPEDQRPATPPAATSAPESAAPQPDDSDDGDEEDDGWDEDDGASLKAPPGSPPGKEAASGYTVRLTGLRMGSVGKPMPVAVWASGGGEVANATIAVRFDEKVLRALKVESTGLFDGKLGAQVPFQVSDGVLYITLARPAEMAKMPVNGQLVNITFDVLGGGTATLAVVPDSTKIVGPDSSLAAVNPSPALVVTAR
jgi:general secretion pathway protein D